MISLKNKVALITGASSGIGAACAKLFSNLDASLVLNGRNESSLNKISLECNKSSKLIKVIGDVSEDDTLRRLVDETIKSFGKLDILINNVGFTRGSASIETLKLDDFDQVMRVNVRSIVALTQLCLPYLEASKGNIVNVSSVSGTRSFTNILAYGISKAALDQFTKSTALELSPKGIRVNSVNPGVIVTNFHLRSGYSNEQYKAYIEGCKKTHALGRVGTADEVAQTIAFLASDAASFITGELVHVDGGKHAMCPR